MSAQTTSAGEPSAKRFYRRDRKKLSVLSVIMLVCGLAIIAGGIMTFLGVQEDYQHCLAESQQTFSQTGVVVGCDLLKPKPIFLIFLIIAVAGGPVNTLLGALQLVMLRHSGLTMSPQGVECAYDLYSYRTTWDNVERITATPFGRWKTVIDCLILREPGVESGGWLRLRASEQYRRVIPLGLYSPAWRDGEIGQEIRKYAPRLLA